MICDHFAQSIHDVQSLIEQLAKQERSTEEAKRSRDKNARQEAEEKANALRSQLLKKRDASLIYLYLVASEKASDVLLREAWQKDMLRNTNAPLERLQKWQLADLYVLYWAAPVFDLSIFPICSFSLSFTFTLAKPYISRDDNPFYLIDNPIVRDKVFGLPMVRPTSWKGNLYSALWQLGHDKENDEQMQRLFGEIRSEESGQAGRLYFYPTFFTQLGLEVINPHDRKRRVGKNPILFECVPAGASGTFSLLYVPFDLIGKDEAEIRRQVAEDLQLVAEAVREMMLTYGFSAKHTSGYGVAEKDIHGKVKTRSDEKPLSNLDNLAQEVKHVAF